MAVIAVYIAACLLPITLRGLFSRLPARDFFTVPPAATLQVTEPQPGVHSPLTATGVASDLESVYSHFGGSPPQALAGRTPRDNVPFSLV